MSARETAKKQLIKCHNEKCAREGVALMRLEKTIGKELQTLNKRNKAGKLSKTQLVKEINNIGKANNVRKAAETYTSCLKTKCAKELSAAQRRKAY
jgi:hypothetical protein